MCRVCGSKFRLLNIGLPFQAKEMTMMILGGLPVLQYVNCGAYLREDLVMGGAVQTLHLPGVTKEVAIIR